MIMPRAEARAHDGVGFLVAAQSLEIDNFDLLHEICLKKVDELRDCWDFARLEEVVSLASGLRAVAPQELL